MRERKILALPPAFSHTIRKFAQKRLISALSTHNLKTMTRKQFTRFDFVTLFAPIACFFLANQSFNYFDWPVVNEGEGYNFIQAKVQMGLAALVAIGSLIALFGIGSLLKLPMHRTSDGVIVAACILMPMVIQLFVLSGYSNFFQIHLDHEAMRPILQWSTVGFMALILVFVYFQRRMTSKVG